MDRFIEFLLHSRKHTNRNLKSNMDRFIVYDMLAKSEATINLKSNMDRFIGTAISYTP